MEIDCENCGKRRQPNGTKCGACGNSFGFMEKPSSEWEPWDFSQWLYSNHFQIYEKMSRVSLSECPRREQINYLVGYLYYQVHNGGLWQYFGNPCGKDAVLLLAALEEIGAKNLRQVLAEACAYFPNGQPQEAEEERWETMEGIDRSVAEDLDERASKLVGSLGPEDLLVLLHSGCARLGRP